MTNQSNKIGKLSRRSVVRGMASVPLIGAGVHAGTAPVVGQRQRTVTVSQGDDNYEVAVLSNGESIEEFYDYYNAESHTTTNLERSNTSLLFFWEDSNGLSLVCLHDKAYDSGGGDVNFDFTGLPSDGAWVVRDDDPGNDYYFGRDRAEWNWNYRRTDGGAYRDISGSTITIDPSFNAGISEWQLLGGSAETPSRQSLSLDSPITIQTGSQATGLAQKVQQKAGLIQQIRSANTDVESATTGGFFPESTANGFDARADAFVGTVEDGLGTYDSATRTQYARGMDVLVASEKAGLAATTKPIQVARQTSGFLLKTIVMYSVEKVGEAARFVNDATDRIRNLPYIEDYANLIGDYADVVLGTVKRHVLGAISGSLVETILDKLADYIEVIQRRVGRALDDESLRDVGKTAATKGVEDAVNTIDDGIIGDLKDVVAQAQEDIAKEIFRDYYLSEVVLPAPLPNEFAIEQHIDDTAGIEVGPITIEPPEIPLPEPLEQLQDLQLFADIQEAADRFTPGGIDTTMNERAARVAAGAKQGDITEGMTGVAKQAGAATEYSLGLVSDLCLGAFNTVYDTISGILDTVERALVVGGLLAYVAKRFTQSLAGALLAAALQGGIVAALTAIGKGLLILTALEVAIGSISLRISANLHWLGTLAAVNPALYPEGADVV